MLACEYLCVVITDVKLLGINEKGQLRLSRKAVMVDDRAANALANDPAKVLMQDTYYTTDSCITLYFYELALSGTLRSYRLPLNYS
jgi:hypothetical protein